MRGIDKFKERFAGHDGEYVLIGGGACDLLFGEAGQDFRATKDLDLVLLVEALTPEFGQVFWDFVKEGGYENRQKSSRKPQFYRFSKPEDPAFPAMLELFARTDVDLRDAESGLMPIHIDDEVSSLSAILLDEEYYRLLVENRTSAGGVAVLSVEGLIPFKAKAWLDLSARRAGGQAVRYGSPVNGLHFYHGDEPKPAPEFFKPAKVKGGKSPAAIAAAAKAAAGNSAPGTDYREHGIQRDRRAVQ